MGEGKSCRPPLSTPHVPVLALYTLYLQLSLSQKKRINSEDDPLLTLQHRATLAWRHFWNLKDQLRARDATMKSRLALLHLAVILVLLLAAETWTPSVKIVHYNEILCITMVQRMEGERRRPGKRWLKWHLRTFRGALARAEAIGFPRADKMVIQKRWSYAGHVARIWTSNETLHWLLEMRVLTWWRDNKRRWRGNRHFHRRTGVPRGAGNNTLTTIGTILARNGKRWRKTDPNLTLA